MAEFIIIVLAMLTASFIWLSLDDEKYRNDRW